MRQKSRKGPILFLILLCAAGLGTGIFTAVKTRNAVSDASAEITRVTIHWEESGEQSSVREVNEVVSGIKSRHTEPSSSAVPETGSVTAAAQTPLLPLGTEITGDYSGGQPVLSKTLGEWRTHNGVDFGGEAGSDVSAAADGIISEVTEDSYWGTVVVLDLGTGIRLRYCGIDSPAIASGDSVKRGDILGKVGEIPIESADSAHIHLEVIKNDLYIDPLVFFGRSEASD